MKFYCQVIMPIFNFLNKNKMPIDKKDGRYDTQHDITHHSDTQLNDIQNNHK